MNPEKNCDKFKEIFGGLFDLIKQFIHQGPLMTHHKPGQGRLGQFIKTLSLSQKSNATHTDID